MRSEILVCLTRHAVAGAREFALDAKLFGDERVALAIYEERLFGLFTMLMCTDPGITATVERTLFRTAIKRVRTLLVNLDPSDTLPWEQRQAAVNLLGQLIGGRPGRER